MSISAVNNIAQTSFTGKIKTTKNGNQYEKTNSAKKVLTGLVAVGWVGASALLGKGNGFKNGFLPALGLLGIDAVPSMAGAFLMGAVIDGLRNKHARKSADKIAELNTQA